jgi:hypothetical protein
MALAKPTRKRNLDWETTRLIQRYDSKHHWSISEWHMWYEPTISSRKIINWQLEAPSIDKNIFLWKHGQMWDVRNVEINNQTPKNKRGKTTPGHVNHLHLAPCGVYRNTSPKTINISTSELLNGPFQFHLLQCHNERCSNKAHPIVLQNPQYWSSVLI